MPESPPGPAPGEPVSSIEQGESEPLEAAARTPFSLSGSQDGGSGAQFPQCIGAGGPPAEAPPGEGSAKGLGGPGWGSSRGHSPVAPDPVGQNIPGVPVGVPLLWALTGTWAFQ